MTARGVAVAAGGPAVTVLVPTFNRPEHLLAQALDSVVGQDYPYLEVIALDDGSTNGTPAVLDRYADANPGRFRTVRHDNMGQARTLNRGFELARGELVGYLADDDLLLPGAIARLVQALCRVPDAVGAYPAFEVIDADGTVGHVVNPLEWSAATALRCHDPIVSVGALVRAEVARAHPWDPDLAYTGDFDFWLRVGLTGRLVLVPEVLARHRSHPGSLTVAGHGDRRRVEDSLAVLDKLFARTDLPAEVRAARGSAYRAAFVTAAFQTTRTFYEPGDRYEVVDRLWEIAAERPARDASAVGSLYGRLPKSVRRAARRRAPRVLRRVWGRIR